MWKLFEPRSTAAMERAFEPMSARPEHVFGHDPTVEVLASDEVELDRCCAESVARLVGALGDLRRCVVADVRREGGDEHQRAPEVIPDGLFVGGEASGAALCKARARVSEQADRLEQA